MDLTTEQRELYRREAYAYRLAGQAVASYLPGVVLEVGTGELWPDCNELTLRFVQTCLTPGARTRQERSISLYWRPPLSLDGEVTVLEPMPDGSPDLDYACPHGVPEYLQPCWWYAAVLEELHAALQKVNRQSRPEGESIVARPFETRDLLLVARMVRGELTPDAAHRLQLHRINPHTGVPDENRTAVCGPPPAPDRRRLRSLH